MKLAKFKAASVQTSPVYLDAVGTTQKACDLIREATKKGAQLVAFPEAFIPAYPYWSWLMSPIEGSSFFRETFSKQHHNRWKRSKTDLQNSR